MSRPFVKSPTPILIPKRVRPAVRALLEANAKQETVDVDLGEKDLAELVRVVERNLRRLDREESKLKKKHVWLRQLLIHHIVRRLLSPEDAAAVTRLLSSRTHKRPELDHDEIDRLSSEFYRVLGLDQASLNELAKIALEDFGETVPTKKKSRK